MNQSISMLAGILLTASALASVTQFNDFQVNTITVNQQKNAVITPTVNGEFFVLWESKYSTENSWYEVAAQRYDCQGIRIGPEFTINQYSTSAQVSPQAARRSDGGFVVTWESNLDDGNEYDIFARIYDPNGNALTGEFRVNDLRTSHQRYARVAVNDNNDFMIVWNSFHNVYDPVRYWEARGRLFYANGTPKTGDFRVTSDFDAASEMVVLSKGSGYIVLVANDARDIQALECSAAGVYIHPVHTLVDLNVSWGFHAHLNKQNGRLALVYCKAASTIEPANIYSKIFDFNYNEVVSETVLNQSSPNNSTDCYIDQLTNGNYVVTWTRKDYTNSVDNFLVRRFSSELLPIEDEQIVNAMPSPFPYYNFGGNESVVKAVHENGYAVAWTRTTDNSVYANDDLDIMMAIGPATAVSDFDHDGLINLRDYSLFSQYWLDNEPIFDIKYEDGIIDTADMLQLCDEWLSGF